MDLTHLIVVLAVLGLVYWLVVTYIPLPPPVRMILTVLLVVVLCIWLLNFVGFGHLRLGH